MNDATQLRVLFVTVSYAPGSLPSDKRFLRDLIQCLPVSIIPAIWTLSEIPPKYEVTQIGDKQVPVNSRCRLGHQPLTARSDILPPHPYHSQLRQILELMISTLYESSRSLKESVRLHKPDVIHFYDNVGPVIGILRKQFPEVVVTCGKASTREIGSKGWSLYRRLLKSTYGACDQVVAYTDAARNVLLATGLLQERVVTIPWGVQPTTTVPSGKASDRIRGRYHCSEGDMLIAVTPRGTEKSIVNIIEFAKSLSQETHTKYVFAIRPTRYSESYMKHGNSQVIIENGPKDFYGLLEVADVVWAPVDKLTVTTLPPLTWIEAMIRGTPVITQLNPGVDECIINNETGFLYENLDDFRNVIAHFQSDIDYDRLSRNARILALKKYNVQLCAKQYLNLWSRVAPQWRSDTSVDQLSK